MTNKKIKNQAKQAQDIIFAVMAPNGDRLDLVRNIIECTLWRIAENIKKQKAITSEEIKKRANEATDTIISVWHLCEDRKECIFDCIECSIRSLVRDLNKKH